MQKKSIQKYFHPMKPLPTSTPARGDLRGKIECILFDIYGTLFISGSGDISLALENSPAQDHMKQLLNKYAISKPPRRILEKFFDSIQTRHRVLRNEGVDHPEVIIEQIWRQALEIDDQTIIRKFAVEFELIANPVSPMPRLESMLSACRQKDMLMGIISNAQFYTPFLFRWFLNSEIEDLGFDPGLLFYSYQYEVAKPSPTLFKMAAEKLGSRGIQPLSVLYVGNDMLNDIYPANAIGFQTALFAGDQRSLRLRTDDPRCVDLKPDLVLTDLGQLLKHI
ncbi:MAG: HAD family hydrolase [Desulfobacterales bacterium]